VYGCSGCAVEPALDLASLLWTGFMLDLDINNLSNTVWMDGQRSKYI